MGRRSSNGQVGTDRIMSEFLNMGGYAVFVWSSFGISFVVLLLNVIVPVMRRKQLIRDVSGHIKRKR